MRWRRRRLRKQRVKRYEEACIDAEFEAVWPRKRLESLLDALLHPIPMYLGDWLPRVQTAPGIGLVELLEKWEGSGIWRKERSDGKP